MISFFVRLPYISINYMEARTQLCISQKLSLMEPRHMKTYSTRKNILMAIDVYSEKYGVIGKIDMYDENKKLLVERKKHVNKIYDGYVFQLYAQYFAMLEMGYIINSLEIRSLDDNKKYKIALPNEDDAMFKKFENLISEIRTFDLENYNQDNIEKCKHCIYEDACDRSLYRGGAEC